MTKSGYTCTCKKPNPSLDWGGEKCVNKGCGKFIGKRNISVSELIKEIEEKQTKTLDQLKSGLLAELREKCAAIEHQRWARWQKYLHSKCVEHSSGEGKRVCFPAKLFRRWEKQIDTPYEKLSKQEKESDRKEVDRYLPLVSSAIDRVAEKTAEAVEIKLSRIEYSYKSIKEELEPSHKTDEQLKHPWWRHGRFHSKMGFNAGLYEAQKNQSLKRDEWLKGEK